MDETPDTPWEIEDELGEVAMTEQQCPGVYYAACRWDEQEQPREYYIVDRDTTSISHEIKKRGTPMEKHPEYLIYPIDRGDTVYLIVKFEAQRYRQKHGLPPLEADNLHTTAVYGMEIHPEYYGEYPAPLVTPRGYTIRYKTIAAGIFLIETDRCETVLALGYPVWCETLSDYVQGIAEIMEADRQNGIDNTLGYLFFQEQTACIALFELMQGGNSRIADSPYVDVPSMMNAIAFRFPEYTMTHNLREMCGLNDTTGHLLKALGCEDVSPTGSEKNLIRISMEDGVETEYLHF